MVTGHDLHLKVTASDPHAAAYGTMKEMRCVYVWRLPAELSKYFGERMSDLAVSLSQEHGAWLIGGETWIGIPGTDPTTLDWWHTEEEDTMYLGWYDPSKVAPHTQKIYAAAEKFTEKFGTPPTEVIIGPKTSYELAQEPTDESPFPFQVRVERFLPKYTYYAGIPD